MMKSIVTLTAEKRQDLLDLLTAGEAAHLRILHRADAALGDRLE